MIDNYQIKNIYGSINIPNLNKHLANLFTI